MSLGEKASLNITSDYGYGARGAGGVIPPNADLGMMFALLIIDQNLAANFATIMVSLYLYIFLTYSIRSRIVEDPVDGIYQILNSRIIYIMTGISTRRSCFY